MSGSIDEATRATFRAIADVLIPAAEGMPAASEVGVHGEVLDRILGLRPDLAERFFAACVRPRAQMRGRRLSD